MDQLKEIKDPDQLNVLYMKNLKEEISLLETHSRILKSKLGILHKEEKRTIYHYCNRHGTQ
jgi:hypothetical protein